MYEFNYAFQLSKKRIFEVRYTTLGSNDYPYFATSAEVFNQPKTDYNMCGQCQEDVCTGLAKQFYEKWDYLHLKRIDNENLFKELVDDIEELKNYYNYIEIIAFEGEKISRSINFDTIRELSKKEPRHKEPEPDL